MSFLPICYRRVYFWFFIKPGTHDRHDRAVITILHCAANPKKTVGFQQVMIGRVDFDSSFPFKVSHVKFLLPVSGFEASV